MMDIKIKPNTCRKKLQKEVIEVIFFVFDTIVGNIDGDEC